MMPANGTECAELEAKVKKCTFVPIEMVSLHNDDKRQIMGTKNYIGKYSLSHDVARSVRV